MRPATLRGRVGAWCAGRVFDAVTVWRIVDAWLDHLRSKRERERDLREAMRRAREYAGVSRYYPRHLKVTTTGEDYTITRTPFSAVRRQRTRAA